MRVVIADDSLLVREGIASLLRRVGVDVVAEADDGEQLVRAVDEHEPDAVVVDVRMPPTHTEEGLEAARAIRGRHPHVGILILSQHVEVGVAMRALVENPQGARLPAQGARHRHRRLLAHAAPRRRAAARRSTRRSSPACSPTRAGTGRSAR